MRIHKNDVIHKIVNLKQFGITDFKLSSLPHGSLLANNETNQPYTSVMTLREIDAFLNGMILVLNSGNYQNGK